MPGASTATGFSAKTCFPAATASAKWSGRKPGGVAHRIKSASHSMTFLKASSPTKRWFDSTQTRSRYDCCEGLGSIVGFGLRTRQPLRPTLPNRAMDRELEWRVLYHDCRSRPVLREFPATGFVLRRSSRQRQRARHGTTSEQHGRTFDKVASSGWFIVCSVRAVRSRYGIGHGIPQQNRSIRFYASEEERDDV